MFKFVIIAVVLLIAVLLFYAATRPDTFRVQRTASIRATPEKIFSFINDLHQWDAWSPYAKLDPAMQTRYSGAASGRGAVYEWQGNGNVGAGRVTVVDVLPPSRVAIKLDMLKPFEAHNDVEFTLQPEGAATHVTWAMEGRNTYLAKVMGVFFNMDKMVGGQFEEGLANLKTLAEK